MRPMPPCLAYHMLPSGPGAMPRGPMLVTLTLNMLNGAPSLLNLLTALGAVLWCVNQSMPSGPAASQPGWLAVGIANSVMVMAGGGGPSMIGIMPPMLPLALELPP